MWEQSLYYLYNHGLSAVASLAFLAAVFIPMEKAFPARADQKIIRSQWWLDLCFFLGQYLIWGTMVAYWLSFAEPYISNILPPTWLTNFHSLHWLLQGAIVVILSDLCVYWGHRLQHRLPFLWRFHKVHHSSEHLDWLAAHREHPLDTIYTVTIINLPAILLGFSVEFMVGLVAFRAIWAIYIHSNVRFPLKWLRAIIGAPELHHWHHDKDKDAGNYANLSPLMDIIFGTYVCPDHEPESLGLHEKSPQTYIGHMTEPFK